MEKFYKLERYLSTKIEDEFELSFDEIERILGFKLTNSAYQYTAYWQPSATHTFANTVEMVWELKWGKISLVITE